jgi:transposase-like protein
MTRRDGQHFLLCAGARTLGLMDVARLDESQAWDVFRRLRWPETEGQPVCPRCACQGCWALNRGGGAPLWRCQACNREFSPTSNTIFAYRKMSIRKYLFAISLYCNEVKGKNALALSRDLNVQYKTAFVLGHKIREAVGSEYKDLEIGGDGVEVEIDGARVGGHVRPENRKAERKDLRLAENQNGKRQCVVVARERPSPSGKPGPGVVAVFRNEGDGLRFIAAHVKRGSTVYADEASGWDPLAARFKLKRICHAVEYANDEANTNQAESYFARLRRSEIGCHHHFSGKYLKRYAREILWREDRRRESNGAQSFRVVSLAAGCPPSVDFCGYWQRNRLNS